MRELIRRFRAWQNRRYWQAHQMEHLRLMLQEDGRWMAHNPIAAALTDRYLAATAEDWYQQVFVHSGHLREQLGLDPHAEREHARAQTASASCAGHAGPLSVVGLGERDALSAADVDQPVAVAATQAEEKASPLIDLGRDGSEHHLQPAGSALPHEGSPSLASDAGTHPLPTDEPARPAREPNLVPGQMRCARCKFQLTRSVLYMGSGTVGAGDSRSEPCPNGCGPLWPVTWEEAARDAWAAWEQMFERAKAAEPFQPRVRPWMLACFGEKIAGDREERNHRFLEEALELVQACGCTASQAHQLVDYTFSRPVGEAAQEVGGVMVTLAALCLANGLDMHAAGEVELARIWTKVEAIRAKQAAKPKHSPLPMHVAAPAERPAGHAMPAPFQVIDPDYARVYTKARIVAWQHGFALLMHGSLTRDLDLLLVPWEARAVSSIVPGVVRHIADICGLRIARAPGEKPHGRIAYTLLFGTPEEPDVRWVDLSVMPGSNQEGSEA